MVTQFKSKKEKVKTRMANGKKRNQTRARTRAQASGTNLEENMASQMMGFILFHSKIVHLTFSFFAN